MVMFDPLGYDLIAGEYYDPVRHPTCHNFAELSERFLRAHIPLMARSAGWIVEVGAGRSVVAPVLLAAGISLDRLLLLDRSPAMLEHSREWRRRGAQLLVGDAAATPIQSGCAALVVAALGDPYNDERFWQDVQRILVPRGACLFTAPAVEWAERFRTSSNAGEAEFLLGDGTAIVVRSNVLPVDEQIRLCTGAGISVEEVSGYYSAELRSPRSSKLDVFNGAAHAPIVRGFVCRKP